MLVHKCLNGRADVCTPVDTLPGRRQLRSAAARQLLVPQNKYTVPTSADVGSTVVDQLRGTPCQSLYIPTTDLLTPLAEHWRDTCSASEHTAVICAAASINVAHYKSTDDYYYFLTLGRYTRIIIIIIIIIIVLQKAMYYCSCDSATGDVRLSSYRQQPSSCYFCFHTIYRSVDISWQELRIRLDSRTLRAVNVFGL